MYKKTIIIRFTLNLSSLEEFELYKKKKKALVRELRRVFFREKIQKNPKKNLSFNKRIIIAMVFISHRKKNSFLTVFQFVTEYYKKVTHKMSCGSIGFRNRKKATDFAREQTIKHCGNFLSTDNVSILDIIYNTIIPYWNKKALRLLLSIPIFVKQITASFNRSHSQKKHSTQPRK